MLFRLSCNIDINHCITSARVTEMKFWTLVGCNQKLLKSVWTLKRGFSEVEKSLISLRKFEESLIYVIPHTCSCPSIFFVHVVLQHMYTLSTNHLRHICGNTFYTSCEFCA